MAENTQILNLAMVCPNTDALGPGPRFAIWVQGCAQHCLGCVAPDWIPQRPNWLTTPAELAERILAQPGLRGVTLSGGEPMLQAEALVALLDRVRAARDLDVICFSGYRMEALRRGIPNPAAPALLERLDVLIDGPYVAELNDNRGLRGSSNQRIHYLTPRLAETDFESRPRKAELRVVNGALVMVGVPPQGLRENVLNSRFSLAELSPVGRQV